MTAMPIRELLSPSYSDTIPSRRISFSAASIEDLMRSASVKEPGGWLHLTHFSSVPFRFNLRARRDAD